MTDTSNKVNTHNGHEFVDLGLPSGLLWATCNVGATSPEQAGLYFAFGETTGYPAEQVEKGTKKFDSASYAAPSVSDNLTLEQDAAHVCMGGKWRMPTKAEYQELRDNCNVMWTKNYNRTGVAGCVFKSKVNGNTVFFPAAGYYYNSSVYGVGSYGHYWSASWISSSYAWYLYLKYNGQLLSCGGRCDGYPARGVCKR